MELQCTIGPKDHLSRLPAELLAWIFELAWGSQQLAGPLSRALLPFDRNARFKFVEVESFAQLFRLAAIFRANRTLPHLIKELHYFNDDPSDIPADFSLEAFFASLEQLSSLVIGGDHIHRIVTFVLSPTFPASVSPLLSCLSIELPDHAANPWDPAHFQHLAFLPRLGYMSLSAFQNDVELPASPQPAPPVTLSHLTDLNLWVTNSPGGRGAACALVNSCPSLHTLDLASNNPADLAAVLEGSTCPALDRLNLCVLSPGSIGHNPPFPFDHFLPRFPTIRHLRLDYGTFTSSTLPAHLAALPSLSTLTFDRDALVGYTTLCALVEGSTRFRSLERVTLDMYTLSCGWQICENGNGELHPHHEDSPLHLGPFWEVDVPAEQLQPREIDRFVRRAEQAGIKVDGTVAATSWVHQVWYHEVTDCLYAWGHHIRDREFVDLARFAGDAFEEILEEKRISGVWGRQGSGATDEEDDEEDGATSGEGEIEEAGL
ncbi:hypothetical protein JCM10207_005721 [Rhodosporidiobolus poonsookiae]